jgi:hypothetical protein
MSDFKGIVGCFIGFRAKNSIRVSEGILVIFGFNEKFKSEWSKLQVELQGTSLES